MPTERAALMIGIVAQLYCSAVFAQQRAVYFVPAGYPADDQIHIVEDGADPVFCTANLEGLDIARTRLGYASCNSSSERSDTRLNAVAQAHDVSVLILVDDRSELSPDAVRLLAGAIQQRFGSEYYVVPFGLQLSNARNAQAGITTGTRAMVVGERLFIDHYESLHAHNAVAMASKGVPGGFRSEL